MKTNIKIVITAIVLLSFHTKVTAQIEDHYHSFSGRINVPIIVERNEVMKYNDGRKIEKNIPDKVTYISFYMNAENMHVSKGVFSGVIVKNGSVEDEVITYKGKVSNDKKKLEYIEIKRDYTVYVLYTREDVEKTISFSARFENIPKSYGGYKYEYGITNIASVSYNEEYAIPRYGYVDSYTETFVKINEKSISSYYTGVGVDFKPGVLKLKLKYDKIAVVNQLDGIDLGNYEMLQKGISTLVIAELMKVPGLKVLERTKIEGLLDEIALSQSGLVDEKIALRADRIMIPDVEVIVGMENRIPKDTILPIESFVIRSKIRIVETGQVIDPNLTYLFNCKDPQQNESLFEYPKKVKAFALNFVYE